MTIKSKRCSGLTVSDKPYCCKLKISMMSTLPIILICDVRSRYSNLSISRHFFHRRVHLSTELRNLDIPESSPHDWILEKEIFLMDLSVVSPTDPRLFFDFRC